MATSPRHPRRAPRRTLLLLLSTTALNACLGQGTPTEVAFPDGLTRVLFIGNSLTYVEDVPALVVAIAQQHGDTTWRAASVAFPDFALEDHWSEGSALRRLTEARWEFVVMQQGPSSLPASQAHLAYWSQQFAPVIRNAGARPVLYGVWPHTSRRGDFPNAQASYAAAADSVDGLLAPAGAAWADVLATHPTVALYANDGLHATREGAYLAALVIYGRLSGVDPRMLPDLIPGMPAVRATTVAVLQNAAAASLGYITSGAVSNGNLTMASMPISSPLP